MGTKNHRHSAFTLVELLIVISIIAILAAISIMLFRGQQFKGNDARRKADINRIKIAVEEYEKDHNCYPPPELLNCNPGTGLRPYIDIVPCDPTTNSSYLYEPESSSCPRWYRFFGDLEYSQDPDVIPGIGPNSAFNYYSGSGNAPVPVGTGLPATPPPAGGGSNYWGCVNRVCVPIEVDSPGNPVCNPSYTIPGCNNDCDPPDPNDHTFDCVPI